MNIRYYLPKVVAIAAIAVLAATSSCFGTVLNVTQRNQEMDQWCWDASSQMVLEFHGNSYSQQAIADWAVGGQNVPNYLYGSTDSNYKGCDEVLSHFGSISSEGLAYAMSLSTLTSEMDAGRPVVLRWGWDSGGGHIAVIHGTDGNTVYVRDPWPANGPQIQSYAWVCRPYGNSGTWTHTLQLAGSANPYYDYCVYYYNLCVGSLNSYASSGSLMDMAYAYQYYAYYGYYLYMYYGDSNSAIDWYNYYMSCAQYYYDYAYYYAQYFEYCYNIACNYYDRYLSTGSQYDAAYFCYYYAYAGYYLYMYYSNSDYAITWYNYYMYWYYYYYNL